MVELWFNIFQIIKMFWFILFTVAIGATFLVYKNVKSEIFVIIEIVLLAHMSCVHINLPIWARSLSH